MRNRSLTAECNKIFNFWKLEEYFTPSDYPEMVLTIKEGKQDIPFDAYYNDYSIRSLPLKRYKAHNEYLSQKNKSDERLYNRANIYCGCYRTKDFVEKMAEKCKLDMEKYAEINELNRTLLCFFCSDRFRWENYRRRRASQSVLLCCTLYDKSRGHKC